MSACIHLVGSREIGRPFGLLKMELRVILSGVSSSTSASAERCWFDDASVETASAWTQRTVIRLSGHVIRICNQDMLSAYVIRTLYQHIQAGHPISTCYQDTLSVYMIRVIRTRYQHIQSAYTVRRIFQSRTSASYFRRYFQVSEVDCS